MTCSFERPYNPVVPEYSLYFSFDKLTSSTQYPCQLTPDYNRSYICSLTFEARNRSAVYRQSYEYYYFRLVSMNRLGNHTQHFTINHYESGKFFLFAVIKLVKLIYFYSNAFLSRTKCTSSADHNEHHFQIGCFTLEATA